jgi:RNA polymerase sigma factor (sigma-70 family)
MPTPITAGNHRPKLLAERDALVEKHVDLVPPIARAVQRLCPASFELDDLISEGYVGLIHAAVRYRPREHNGTPFSAFARLRIHGAIVDSVRRRCWTENTHFPLDDAPEPVHHRAMPFLVRGRHIMEPDTFRGGWRPPFRRAHLPKPLARAFRTLPARQQAILGAFYADAATLPDVAGMFGLTVSRAAREHRTALESLRAALGQNVSRDAATQLYFSDRPAA